MVHQRTPKFIPWNPLSRPLAVAACLNLVAVGLAIGLDLAWLHQVAVYWLPPLCMALAIGYTLFALNIGWIAIVGHIGQIHHYSRANNPIGYWLLLIAYLAVSLPALGYWLLYLLPANLLT